MSDPTTSTYPGTSKRPRSEPPSPSTGSSTLDSEHDQHPRRRLRMDSPVTETVVDPSFSVPSQEEIPSHPIHTDTFELGDQYIPWGALTSEQIEIVKKHWDTCIWSEWRDRLEDMRQEDPRRLVSDIGLVRGTPLARAIIDAYPEAQALVKRFQKNYNELKYYYEMCTHGKEFSRSFVTVS